MTLQSVHNRFHHCHFEFLASQKHLVPNRFVLLSSVVKAGLPLLPRLNVDRQVRWDYTNFAEFSLTSYSIFSWVKILNTVHDVLDLAR